MPSNPGILRDREVDALLLAALRTGLKTDAQCERVVQWATETRINHELLGLVLAGRVNICFSDDGLAFRSVSRGKR